MTQCDALMLPVKGVSSPAHVKLANASYNEATFMVEAAAVPLKAHALHINPVVIATRGYGVSYVRTESKNVNKPCICSMPSGALFSFQSNLKHEETLCSQIANA